MPPSRDEALEIVTIPCLADNYAYLVLSPDGRSAALVDAPEPRRSGPSSTDAG
jgi:hypothetical protein